MADMNKSINIEVTATDDASKPIEKIGKESKGSLSAVKRFGAGAASAFAKVGAAGVMVNQSIELLKKFRDVGLIAIEATRAFVDANDPLIKSFDNTANSVKRLSAGVGVVLMKGLNGAAKALDPIIKKSQAWLQKNQNLIGLKLVEYIERFAKFSLVTAAKSIVLVTKVTSGFASVWELLKLTVNTVFGFIARGIAKSLKGYELLASAVGMDGLAGKLRVASATAQEMGAVFDELGEKNQSNIGDIIHGQEKLEQQINTVGEAVYNAIGQVATGASKAFVGETVLANKTLEQQTAILEQQKAAQEAKAEKERQAAEARAKFAEQQAAQAAAEKSRVEGLANEYGALGSSIGGAFVAGFGAAEEGQNKFAEGFKAMTAQMIDAALAAMQNIVTIRAAEAAAGAASSQASIPIIGPALAAAAAATMFSLVRGFIQLGFQGMAQGGMVKGGVQGHDSVPIMAQAGEMVLSRDQVDRMRQEGGLNGGGQVTIEMNSQIPAGRAEIKRFVRQNVVPALKELRTQGMF